LSASAGTAAASERLDYLDAEVAAPPPTAMRPARPADLPTDPPPLHRRWSRAALARADTTLTRELVSGLTTFGAVSYVIVVNPAIVSAAGPDVRSLIVITALVSMLGTLIMALLADLPVALAPGMGMNAVFAQTIVVHMGVPYPTALVIVFVSGAAFLALSITRLRAKIMQGFPEPVLIGMQGGLGLFIAYLGLLNGGLVINSAQGPQFGNLADPAVLLVAVGVLLTPVLLAGRVPAALLLSIAAMAGAGLFVHHAGGKPMAVQPARWFDLPRIPSELFLNLDFGDFLRNFVKLAPVTFYFFISNFFYTGSTLITVLRRANMEGPNGAIIYERRAYAADAIATTLGAALGSSTVGAYVESAAGVEAGGRTGLSALVVAALFALAIVAWPLIVAIPPEATAPALVITGILMLDIVATIDVSAPETMVPPLLMMLVTVVTSDLMMALCLGCFAYTLIAAARRRWQALTPMLVGLDIILGLYLAVMNATG
jgi:AGZA family xanthine/uracil permease-like MFS transporter